MTRLTLNKVNKAIQEKGGSETLNKGEGYFYFWDGKAPDWFETMVCVHALNHLTLKQWMEEYDRLSAKGH